MKALLVADNDRAITNISTVLKSAGYDTIVYKWLLKALDNIEEISPHLIVISTGDYPRHWKTLAQYASNGFGDYIPQVILYTDENFNDEELKKAEALHVRGCFSSVEVDGLDKLREILAKTDDIFSGYLTDEEQEAISIRDLVPESETRETKTSEEPNGGEESQVAEPESAKESTESDSSDENEGILTVSEIMDSFEETPDFKMPGTDALVEFLNNGGNEDFEETETDDIIDSETDDTIDSEPTTDETQNGETDMADEQSIEEKLAAIMNANKADAKEKAAEFKIEDLGASAVSFVFTNPITLAMVSGVARNYNGMTLEFTPDIPSFIMNLDAGTKIAVASMKLNGTIENVQAEVMSNDANKLYLQIKKF